ncbi:antibiotic biosynthesis monooxygenase [Providencia sp.]
MIAVLFEAYPVPEHENRYFQLAAELKSELTKINGFISIERFQSLTTNGRILSLSWWENEEAILEWKNNLKHQHAQYEGQTSIFSQYYIRVAQVIRDYSLN